MGGLVLDLFIVFFYRMTTRLFKGWRARSWPIAAGTLTGASANSSISYPQAIIYYSYTVKSVTYDGSYKREYWSRKDAESFARNLLRGSSVRIRYRAEAPDESALREEDQQAEAVTR